MYKKEKSIYEKTGTQKDVEEKADGQKKNLTGSGASGRDLPEKDRDEFIQKSIESALRKEKELWQKELEERVAREREDAAKLASMSSEERAKEEMDRRQRAFESEREQYMSERAEFEAAKELAACGLPVSFASMVASTDREKLAENIDVFKTEYMKAIEQGLSERLKGKAPRISAMNEQGFDPFLSGLGM